jgi:hypothetical protein
MTQTEGSSARCRESGNGGSGAEPAGKDLNNGWGVHFDSDLKGRLAALIQDSGNPGR